MDKLPRLTAGIVAPETGLALKYFTRLWDAICTRIEAAIIDDGTTPMAAPLVFASYTVATLPTVGTAQIVFASNGRKNGEGAGLGTGVIVFSDGIAWRACDTGATVAA